MNNKKVEKVKVENFKLPKYLKLAKGTMFLDIEGADASGVRLYASKEIFVGREIEFTETRNAEGFLIVKNTPLAKDKHNNKNINDFGKVDNTLPWYVDTSKIDSTKLSRLITAYKYGILTEADPNVPPDFVPKVEPQKREFEINDKGERIFSGKNKDMFVRLQNMNFKDLREFVTTFPDTAKSKENLMDLYAYELRGYNPLNRPRLEVLDLIKKKLKKYGPGISAIRINED
jgi:hypothetical protein